MRYTHTYTKQATIEEIVEKIKLNPKWNNDEDAKIKKKKNDKNQYITQNSRQQ